MPDTKVLINCNVFDGSSPQVQPDRYVLVRDGEIAEIGRRDRPRRRTARQRSTCRART